MTGSTTPEEPSPPADNPDTDGQSLHERMQRLRTGTEEQPEEPEEPAQPEPVGRAPRVARKEPGRRVRERERAAAVREPSPAPPTPERKREPRAVRPAKGARGEEGDGGATEAATSGPIQGGDPAEVVGERLATRLAALRAERDWSLQDLARRTGISRSNLSRIERGEVSPPAEALVRLAAAYDYSLSGLLAEVESQPRSLVRAAEQAVTGEDAWRRRVVSPPYPGLNGSVTDAQLVPGTDVTYHPPLPGAEQHLWLITGSLEVTLSLEPGGGAASTSAGAGGEPADEDPELRAEKEGDYVLIRGDCLRLRLWGPARLRCLSPDPARYALFTVTP